MKASIVASGMHGRGYSFASHVLVQSHFASSAYRKVGSEKLVRVVHGLVVDVTIGRDATDWHISPRSVCDPGVHEGFREDITRTVHT